MPIRRSDAGVRRPSAPDADGSPRTAAPKSTSAKPAQVQQRPGPVALLTYQPNLITDNDRDELRSYARRGSLLTPPVGHIDPKVVRVRQHIEAMVQKLAGDKLAEKGIRLVVNIYGSDDVNAFVADRSGAETRWHNVHGSEVWPIRRMLGRTGDEAPIVELGVDTGLLRFVETEDELAFVLAHEMTHLLEGHLESGDSATDQFKRLAAAQAHETEADIGGLDLLAHAGYRPEAAVQFFRRVFASQGDATSDASDDDKLAEGIQAGAADHHHPGVRIALDQAKIESLRRYDRVAIDGASKPLPGFLNIAKGGRDSGRLRDVAGFERALTEVTKRHFLGTAPLRFGSGVSSHADVPRAVSELTKYSPRPTELEGAVRRSFGLIRDADVSAQQRGDAILRLLRFVVRSYGRTGHVQISDDLINEMATYAARLDGPTGWRAAPALNRLILDSTGDREHSTDPNAFDALEEIAYFVVLEPPLAPFFDRLWKHGGGEWRQLVEAFIDSVYAQGDKVNVDNLAFDVRKALAGTLGQDTVRTPPRLPGAVRPPKTPPVPLGVAMRASMIRAVERLMHESRTASLSNGEQAKLFQLFGAILKPSRDVVDTELGERLRAVIAPEVDRITRQRDESLGTFFANGPALDTERLHELVSMLASDEVLPIGAATRARLVGPLVQALRYRREHHDYPADEVPLLLTSTPARAVLASFLQDPAVDVASQREIAAFLLAHLSYGKGFEAGAQHEAIAASLTSMAAAMPRAELVRVLTARAGADHEARLGQGLASLFGVAPDASDAAIASLAERVVAREFAVDLEDFRGEDGKLRVAAYFDAMHRRSKDTAPLARALGAMVKGDANRQLSLLTSIGRDTDVSGRIAAQLSAGDVEAIVKNVHRTWQRDRDLSDVLGTTTHALGSDACAFLVDALLVQQDKGMPLETWYGLLSQVVEMSPTATYARSGAREKLSAFLRRGIEGISGEALYSWLARPHVLGLLSSRDAADLLVASVTPASGELTAPVASVFVQRLEKELSLSTKYPDVYFELREELAESAHLQPGEVEQVFPSSGDDAVGPKVGDYGAHIRGLSAIVALTEKQPAADQMAMIEYLMGRSASMPAFVQQASERIEAKAGVPFASVVESARLRLSRESVLSRVLVANSFLAGPGSFAATDNGRKALLDHLLEKVTPENQALAHKLAHALLAAQGDTDSLALAYVLAQKPREDGHEMREGDILSALFDAYGVPGQKFKQYLAFTGEFAPYREIFAEAQDNAMPLGYFEILRLVGERFPQGWPADLKIKRVLGQGSVNIALEYTTQDGKSSEVLNTPRHDIAKVTEYDFERVRRFLSELNRDPADRDKFGYLLGLAGIIEKSVRLEFDRESVFDMQRTWEDRYKGVYRGWEISTVDARRLEGPSMFVEKAQGKTARKIYEADKALYRDAMTAMSDWEYDVLLGIDHASGSSAPVATHANPDFHDGQVLIEPNPPGSATKGRVTLIDPGQAVPIDNRERAYAVDLLRIIGRPEKGERAKALLASWIGADATKLDAHKIDEIVARPDLMDRFIHLLSYLGLEGHEVPLAAVHWIMAVNRQIRLGEKVGTDMEERVRNLVRSDVLGFDLGTYNSLHSGAEWARNLKDRLLGGF